MLFDVSHRRMRRNIAAHVDGELTDPALVADVEAHLRECWMCSCDAEAWRLIRCSLRRLAEHRPVDLGAAPASPVGPSRGDVTDSMRRSASYPYR